VVGLTFGGDIDPAAIATFVLAVVAVVGLLLTRRSLSQTQEEIALSRREVEEAHRPVVVPILIPRDPAASSTTSSRHTLPRGPTVVDPGVLAVPLKNIGAGPALRLEASITRLSDDGTSPTGPTEPQTPGTLCGIGASEIAAIEIFAHAFEDRWHFEVSLTYEDLAGKRWQTVARWNAGERRYTGLEITTA
jgi:hypothetical protein